MGFIDNLISGIPINPVLRERLLLVEEKYKLLEKEKVELQEKVTGLEQHLAECIQQLSAYVGQEEFIEHRGALFKRSPSGGYVNSVYCPKCHNSVGSHGDLPFYCIPCKWLAGFKKNELNLVIQSIPEQRRT